MNKTKWALFLLILAGCATKDISFETEIVKPPRPERLKEVSVFEKDNSVCMDPKDFAKTFEYITDMENYADKLEILLDSVTKEVQ